MTRSRKNKRTIIDLSKLSPEDQFKGSINATKAGVGFATTLAVQDSAASVDGEITETVVETEDADIEEVKTAEATGVEPVVEGGTLTAEQTKSDDTPAITPEVLQEMLGSAVAKAIEPLQERVSESEKRNQELETQLSTAQQELTSAKKSTDAIEQLSKLVGARPVAQQGMPNVNTFTAVSDGPTGILKEFMQEREMSGVRYTMTPKGSVVPTYDTHNVDSFVIQNGFTDKSSANYRRLMDGMTEWGKKHGLFQGRRSISESQIRSATTAGNIPGGFLEVLSSMMRVSSRPGLVFWQFAKTVHNFDQSFGELVEIPRARYPDAATNSDQRLLSGSGVYNPITNANDSVQTGVSRIELQEYGRGRDDAAPIAIPTFVSNYSMLPLMQLLERDLFHDYYRWEDLIIREQWKPTTQVFYNNGDQLASTAAAVTTGGTLTRKFLGELYTWFADAQVVPFPDNCYGLVVSPTSINQLKNDMDKYWQVPTESELLALTNMMLLGYPNGENMKIDGYVGKVQGFHIFTTNSFMVGAAGKEGVFSETNGAAGTSTFREGYAFGDATAGRAIGGTGVQIIYDENNDFGRINRAIWHTFEGHGPLDVDPSGYNDTQVVPQELRVARIRLADVAVA